jgi:hypothetical protein
MYDCTSLLTTTATLQDRLPELGTITIHLQHIRVSSSNIFRWKYYIYSEHQGLLYRTSRLARTSDEAMMEMYTRYRESLIEHSSRRGRAGCSCCDVDVDEEESEDEGYSEA